MASAPEPEGIGGTPPAAAPPIDPDFTCEIVRCRERWDALRDDWSALYRASRTASPPLRWDWMRDWWEIYGAEAAVANGRAGDEGLRVAVARRSGTPVAILPLYLNRGRPPIHRRTLMFLSSGEDEAEEICAVGLDLLSAPEDTEAAGLAIRQALLETADWDAIDLGPIDGDSPLARWSESNSGLPCTRRERGVSYAFDLRAGFEGYLADLSANTRGVARKRMRQALRSGASLEVAGRDADPEEVFEELVALHQGRWERVGKPGCFSAPRFRRFHLAQVRRGAASGQAVLARLRCGGQTLAATLGYGERDKLDVYVSGTRIDHDSPVNAPGVALQLLLAQRMAAEGYLVCDHLAGASAYKLQFATSRTPKYDLLVERPTMRTRLSGALEAGKRLRRLGISAISVPAAPRNPTAAGSEPPDRAHSGVADRARTT